MVNSDQILEIELIEIAAWVSATTITRLKFLENIEDPDKLEKVEQSLYSLKTLEELDFSFQKLKLPDDNPLSFVRSMVHSSVEFTKKRVRLAQKQLEEMHIDIYHV